MGAIAQKHSNHNNREEVDNMQQSSKIVGRGSKRGHKSKERGVRKVYTYTKTTVGWEEYATARKKVTEMADNNKKGLWKDVIHKTNEDFDGGMTQMWAGIKAVLGQQAGEADAGIATLRAHSGKMVCSSKGKREVHVEHYRKLATPTANETFDAEFE